MLRKTLIFSIACFLAIVPSIMHAEDTAIFGGSEINLPPNVLIMFDNSGSMDETVTVQGSTVPWNPSTAYSGDYNRRYVYRTDNGTYWYQDVSIGSNEVVDSGEIACEDTRTKLNTLGHWMGTLSTKNNYDPCICR